jgi:hypothetical protein
MQIFLQFQIFNVNRPDTRAAQTSERLSDMSGHAWSYRLLIWQWTIRTSVYHVRSRSLQVFSQLAFSANHTTLHCFHLSCHVVCFARGLLPRFWHSLHISSHSMIFFVSSFVHLSFCAFRILEYLLGYFLEILCMKILFCLHVGWILIYLCYLDYYICFCTSCASKLQVVIIPHYFWN